MGGYKVCIVWLPERMNPSCANKLLKLIEEPPTQTVFLMVSEEPERLLETITSRTQRIEMKKIGGRQSDSQKVFEQACKEYKVKYVVCYSLEEFQAVVEEYLEK